MRERREMTAATLKWIAVISMLIDHFGASIIEGWLYRSALPYHQWLAYFDYYCVRAIGRLAFPIFIFLMVEGLYHTHNRWLYIGRLVLLAAISELPFDVAIFATRFNIDNHQYFYNYHQNVFFTLSIGLLMMVLLEMVRPHSRFFALDREVAEREGTEIVSEPWYMVFFRLVLCVVIMGAMAYLNHRIRADYAASGIIAFACMYWMNVWTRSPWRTVLLGVAALVVFCSITEGVAIIDALIVRRYRGAKGKSMNKWFFYFIYPVHLIIYGCILVFFII